MKHLVFPAGVAATGLLVCSLLHGEPLPSATPQPTATPSVSAGTVQSQSAALMEQARLNQEENHKRSMEFIEKAEGLYKRQEDDITRFEKILATWERQQAQYQKYLDSLSTK